MREISLVVSSIEMDSSVKDNKEFKYIRTKKNLHNRNGRVVNGSEEEAEVLSKYFCSLYGQQLNKVFISYFVFHQ